MSQLLPPYPLMFRELSEGRVIPFLGAGASLGGRTAKSKWKKGGAKFLPTAGELASYLAKTTQFPKDEVPDLTKVAQYYNVVAGRQSLNSELRSIFNQNYPLTPLHTFLAGLPKPLLIVTTNYDDLIERALDDRRKPFDRVIHTTDAKIGDRLLWWPHGSKEPREVVQNKLDIDMDRVTVIYKMHGAVDRRQSARDQYVITEDDYIDFLTRMTSSKAVPAIFAEPFLSRRFLFLGYGLRDWNLRVVLNRIERHVERKTRENKDKSWAIQYKPSPLERRFWQERGVEVYDMMLDKFVKELERAAKA